MRNWRLLCGCRFERLQARCWMKVAPERHHWKIFHTEGISYLTLMKLEAEYPSRP